jgi:hypothetical protein
MHTVRMVGGDLAPRNIDIATRRTDADVDDNRRASCFRDYAPQIGKLFAFVSAVPTTKMRLIVRSASAPPH